MVAWETGIYFDAYELAIPAGTKLYVLPSDWSPFVTLGASVLWFSVPISNRIAYFPKFVYAGAGLEYRSYRGTLFRITVYPRLFAWQRLPAIGLTVGKAF